MKIFPAIYALMALGVIGGIVGDRLFLMTRPDNYKEMAFQAATNLSICSGSVTQLNSEKQRVTNLAERATHDLEICVNTLKAAK